LRARPAFALAAAAHICLFPATANPAHGTLVRVPAAAARQIGRSSRRSPRRTPRVGAGPTHVTYPADHSDIRHAGRKVAGHPAVIDGTG